jgi:hypothetical protein
MKQEWVLSATSPLFIKKVFGRAQVWLRTNVNSTLLVPGTGEPGQNKEGKLPRLRWPCLLTCSLMQDWVQTELLQRGRNWIQPSERWLRHFRNWKGNVNRQFPEPFPLLCNRTRQPADPQGREGALEGAPHSPWLSEHPRGKNQAKHFAGYKDSPPGTR